MKPGEADNSRARASFGSGGEYAVGMGSKGRGQSKLLSALLGWHWIFGGIFFVLALWMHMEMRHSANLERLEPQQANAVRVYRESGRRAKGVHNDPSYYCVARNATSREINIRIAKDEYDRIDNALQSGEPIVVDYYPHLVFPGYHTRGYGLRNQEGMYVVAVALLCIGAATIALLTYRRYKKLQKDLSQTSQPPKPSRA